MPLIYEKFLSLVRKNMETGACPRTKMEEMISRDFRLCRDDVRRIFKEIHLDRIERSGTLLKKKKVQSVSYGHSYNHETSDDYEKELHTFL